MKILSPTTTRFSIEPRQVPSRLVQLQVVLASLVGALGVGAALLLASGHSPSGVYRAIYESAFGSPFAVSETLVNSAPLILTAAATAIVFRIGVYSIGMDGQLIAGAIASSGVALLIGGDLSAWLTVPLVLLSGVVGGIAWSLIPALARAYLGTNEVLSTLMLNFIATAFVSYLVVGSSTIWRDQTQPSLAQPATIPESSVLPHLFEMADYGIVISVVAVVAVAAYMNLSRRGFEAMVIGDSVEAAKYAGMNVARNIAFAFCLSGALCGLAGAIQITSVTQALDPAGVSPGLGIGFTGIVVAALARFSIVAAIPVAGLMSALLNSSTALQAIEVPSALVIVLQGVALLLVVGGQFFLTYRFRFRSSEGSVA